MHAVLAVRACNSERAILPSSLLREKRNAKPSFAGLLCSNLAPAKFREPRRQALNLPLRSSSARCTSSLTWLKTVFFFPFFSLHASAYLSDLSSGRPCICDEVTSSFSLSLSPLAPRHQFPFSTSKAILHLIILAKQIFYLPGSELI